MKKKSKFHKSNRDMRSKIEIVIQEDEDEERRSRHSKRSKSSKKSSLKSRTNSRNSNRSHSKNSFVTETNQSDASSMQDSAHEYIK